MGGQARAPEHLSAFTSLSFQVDKMDRKKNWDWLLEHMPRTVAMLREYRELGEGGHVDECWRHGVLAGLPNWFYAREGVITLGTPFDPLPATSTLGAMEQCELARTGTQLLLAPLGKDLDFIRRRQRISGKVA